MHSHSTNENEPTKQDVALDVELSNIGPAAVALSSIKVELSVERGASQLLAEWLPPSSASGAAQPGGVATAAPHPPQQPQPSPHPAEAWLQPGCQRVLRARFDVRELGQCSLSCSAVFRGEWRREQRV